MNGIVRAVICVSVAVATAAICVAERVTYEDSSRARTLAVEVYSTEAGCTPSGIAIISAGYGMKPTDYGFIANPLSAAGYLVAGIQPHLDTDSPLASSGDILRLRMPALENGVADLQLLLESLRSRNPSCKRSRILLIGHSHGGDVAMLFATRYPSSVGRVITLDHRRVPIPRLSQPRIMTIRADEFAADPGVLPASDEARRLGITVLTLRNTKHGSFGDEGDSRTKAAIVRAILDFVDER